MNVLNRIPIRPHDEWVLNMKKMSHIVKAAMIVPLGIILISLYLVLL